MAAKKKPSTNEQAPSVSKPVTYVPTLRTFIVPEYGVSVEAESAEDAVMKAKKKASKK